ncbi:MAG: group II intron reverse transcriptase/maturase [Deltaproteobacteria bacterium]|jgi:group II intron reverse transcriptase/maturase|nr:group II intron reverse transcriptase/maturase [Deltaproteobacteria bacterium]
MEERGIQEENMFKPNTLHTQGCESQPEAPEVVINGIERVRQAAMKDKNLKFTSLMHHITPDLLWKSFMAINRNAAPGVDGVLWDEYKENLDDNIMGLYADIKAGAYRALPSRRQYIPKADGKLRPLGIASLEDKIVQRAVVEVLSAIYEVDFTDFSFGFRPNRGCHDALDLLYIDITQKKVNWILDADIQGFFDAISHDWMIRFLEHRIADPRMIRLIQQWLKAGIMEESEWKSTDLGTPQGGSGSPLLANVYLHYVLDLWVEVQKKEARGEIHFVRYADDFVVGFQYKDDAERFHRLLGERLRKFDLTLHPTKTRLFEFGRFAAENRRRRGLKKPETFDFLGFTHICSLTRANRKFKLLRKTILKRRMAKLKSLGMELRKRINWSIKETGRWLKRVVTGYFNYYAVHDNLNILGSFRYHLGRLWMQTVRRRSHKAKMKWDKFVLIIDKWLPKPTLVHPYPNQRKHVGIQLRSPVR